MDSMATDEDEQVSRVSHTPEPSDVDKHEDTGMIPILFEHQFFDFSQDLEIDIW